MPELTYEELEAAIAIVKDDPSLAIGKASAAIRMSRDSSDTDIAVAVLDTLQANPDIANRVLVAMRMRRDVLEQDVERIAEERRKNMVKQVIADSFSHVPYLIVQTAMGIEDGDYATIYDAETGGPYASKFGDEIGGEILQLAIDEIGIEAFEQRKARIGSPGIAPQIDYKLPSDPEDTDFDFLGKLAAAATCVHLCKALGISHGFVPGAMEHDMANFFQAYARSEHLFDISHGTSPLPR